MMLRLLFVKLKLGIDFPQQCCIKKEKDMSKFNQRLSSINVYVLLALCIHKLKAALDPGKNLNRSVVQL